MITSKMKTSFCLFIVAALVLHHQAKAQSPPPLLGRPDGRELGRPEQKPAESDDKESLLGRPDGHEPASDGNAPLPGRRDGHEPAGDGSAPLLGRRDGHEPESWQENSKDASDDDENDDEYNDEGEVGDSEEEYSWPAEDEDEPLVRCKRPMCLIYCENGFETDASGCPTCHCKKSDSSLIGRPDGHEPAASDCGNRPMCEMYCENGFKVGDDGCPICECNNTGTTGIDQSDAPQLASDCGDRPLCRMFCDLGFQTDERGCPVCLCLEDPCQRIDCDGICKSQPCESRRSCTQLTAKCIRTQQSLPCPEPMCANACPDGYLKNEQGCMTCQCAPVPAERLCGDITCDRGQVCRNITSGPRCTVKTICEIRRERPVALGGSSLQCEADGSFKPMQCNSKQADCWCVDGLGQEVIGTRSTVYVDEHKPKCLRNITISMHVHLTLVVKHDVDITNQMGSLNTTIIDHVSSWLLVEPHYVTVVKAEPVTAGERNHNEDSSEADSSDEDDDDGEGYAYESYDDNDELDGSRLVVVELVVMHDGQSDLPSAANYMKQRMHQGLCGIPFDKGSLLPNPYSLKTEHRFAQQMYEPIDVIAEPDRCVVDPKSWYCWRKHYMGMCSIGTAAVITVAVLFPLLIIILIVIRRRRMRTLAFKHRVLDNQSSVDRSFLDDDADKPLPVDGDNYPTKEEKLPIA